MPLPVPPKSSKKPLWKRLPRFRMITLMGITALAAFAASGTRWLVKLADDRSDIVAAGAVVFILFLPLIALLAASLVRQLRRLRKNWLNSHRQQQNVTTTSRE